jgi:hypothetical protein
MPYVFFQYRFVNVELVFRLLKGYTLFPFENFISDLFATMGGQTVQDNGILFSLGK